MRRLPDEVTKAIAAGECLGIILSQPLRDAADSPSKITVRPITLRGATIYQFASRRGPQEFHENLDPQTARQRVEQLFGRDFAHCHAFTIDADFSVQQKRDGSFKIARSRPTRTAVAEAHDREKQYLIPAGTPCPFLAEIGVMTESGQVRAPQAHKFRQINRFLELVNDVIPALPAEGILRVVDFGCGKSSLTFALHHLLTAIHGRDVEIVGLDRNVDVIRGCTALAEKLECQGLTFRQGDIASHDADGPVDLAVSLHACDTATDDALAKAIGWQARVILAVPCCQHELARLIASDAERAILRHGLLLDRQATLVTDALRVEALEILGYRTQVVEFIELEHTAKNVLIRAVRRDDDAAERETHVTAYRDLKSAWGLGEIHLEQVLGEEFRRRIRLETL